MQSFRLTSRFVFASLLAMGGTSPLYADDTHAEVIEDLKVGLAGYFKLGKWSSVDVTLRAGSQNLEGQLWLETTDVDGVVCRYVEDQATISILAGQRRTIHRFAKFAAASQTCTAIFQSKDGATISREFRLMDLAKPIRSTQEFVVTIGGDIGIEKAVARRTAGTTVVGKLEDPSDFPVAVRGYDGVDAVLLSTYNIDLYKSVGSRILDALSNWVHTGGRLLLCSGSSGGELFDQKKLTRFVPGQFDSLVTNPNIDNLVDFAGASSGIEPSVATPLRMTALQEVRGKIEVSMGEYGNSIPGLVRTPAGLGQVIFLAFDLDAEPILGWSDRPRLLGKILDLLLGESFVEDRQRRSGAVSRIGYDDISGQLTAATDSFPGVSLVPFSVVAVLAVLFIALIGPVDYFLLNRFVRRARLTWVTFPAIVLTACGGAYLLANRWHGNHVHINELSLVDIDAESGWARGTLLTSLFSPRNHTYDLVLTPRGHGNRPATIADIEISWHAIPGDGFGGIDSPNATLSSLPAYSLHTSVTDGRLRGFPVADRASRAIAGSWKFQTVGKPASKLSADSNGELTGEIANPLDVALSDCLLVYDRWAYPLKRLEPGETISISQLKLRSLEYLLTRRRVDMEELENIPTAWNAEDQDIPRIMEMIMFQGAAGGPSYTRLAHRYHRDLDLSDHLLLGRAVLVGRADRAAYSFDTSDAEDLDQVQTQSRAFYRIIIPVEGSKP